VTASRVLIVDDNPQNVKLVRLLLADEGYDVRTAGDAEEALQILDGFEAQAILMDIQLPGMDGLELTRQLKADTRWKALVVIALTAYAMKGDEEKALAAGCDGYVTKPIDIDALVELLPRLIAAKAPAG
jgi:two-component system cell cycle response regulator DivK